MAIGATTVANLAAGIMETGDRGGGFAQITNAWFPQGAPSVLGAMAAMYRLTAKQVNLIVAALANSPTQPWSALTVAQRTASLSALFGEMQATATGRAAGVSPSSNTTSFVYTSLDGNTVSGVQGGDLVAWLGANVN